MKKIFILIVIFSVISYGQVSADLTIENQEVVGTDFLFDLFLTSTGTNDLYLGNADFVLTFDAFNFNSPVLSKEGTAPGFCSFVPTNQSDFNTLITQMNYFNSTAVEEVSSNQLVISLNGPTPSDTAAFNSSVAWIDNSPSTHRLGKFKVSGIDISSGNMNLQWVIASTLVFTLDPNPPFQSTEITINAIDPANVPLPVELTNFMANVIDNKVELKWETKTEVNNYGFEVERYFVVNAENKDWQKIGFVEGNGNSNSPKEYSLVDKNLKCGDYSYRLKQVDTDGQFEYSSEVFVSVEIPTDYVLKQNYPNPFNPTTTIEFSIPEDGLVRLVVFNLLGEQIRALVNEQRRAGSYTELFDASSLNSGIYFYELRVNNFIVTKKMQLIK